MCTNVSILNGAFSATLVKGKWEYKPNIARLGKRKIDKGTEKEKPQYSFIAKAEKEVVSKYNKQLSAMTIDIVKFLKQQQ